MRMWHQQPQSLNVLKHVYEYEQPQYVLREAARMLNPKLAA